MTQLYYCGGVRRGLSLGGGGDRGFNQIWDNHRISFPFVYFKVTLAAQCWTSPHEQTIIGLDLRT
jgi:hypothetical protein